VIEQDAKSSLLLFSTKPMRTSVISMMCLLCCYITKSEIERTTLTKYISVKFICQFFL
jgi:hypothetical protein